MENERSTLGLTAPQEDYLKQIFLLGERGGSVGTQSLAGRLGVRPASVTGMVQRLAEANQALKLLKDGKINGAAVLAM